MIEALLILLCRFCFFSAMKKLILFLLIVPIISFGQENLKKIRKGIAYIIPIDNDIYQSAITGKNGFSGQNRFLQRSNIEILKNKALAKAEEFANNKKTELEVVGFEKMDQSTYPYLKVILTFRLVKYSNKNNEFIDQNNLKISKTNSESNIDSLNTVEQTSIKEVNIKDEAIKEIKQLKELLDSGILTKNEYEKRASELKKIILGN